MLVLNTRGRGRNTVGRWVASGTRHLQFETSHRHFYLLSTELKRLNNKNEAGNGRIKN